MKNGSILHEAIQIAEEVKKSIQFVNKDEVETLINHITSAKTIFLAGLGRSGLMTRAFAMRLMQMGYQVHVVGETVTPAIGPKDLLIIGSGSGETQGLLSMTQKAKQFGARIALLTVQPSSNIGQLADAVVQLPGATKDQSGITMETVQPMASLFEQTLLIVLDAVILKLMSQQDLSSGNMFGNHANLE
ncbi:6-phospho-3-hexuloisomerase [Paenibacillus lemnae]|uniref:6-phospho-3-hexuloisomerase n=1 Tax=Paenibacillus lemnae TaxID=1330551 RepID=A0A848MAS5_PAELE|nr:6-phospho-3-hexuloisomerase [Paenibacillus lemnae]NMO97646.1 6-phospho-3-hexuloisomerase [Paenibacillus lemnae]